MFLSINQLSSYLDYSPMTTRRIVRRFAIPYVLKDGTMYIDTSNNHHFMLSLRIKHINNELKVLYTVRDIANLLSIDKKTALKILKKNNINMYGNVKKYILLYDLRLLKEQFEEIIAKIEI